MLLGRFLCVFQEKAMIERRGISMLEHVVFVLQDQGFSVAKAGHYFKGLAIAPAPESKGMI